VGSSRLLTAWSLLRQGRVRELLGAALDPWVRVVPLRFDVIDVGAYVDRGAAVRVPMTCRIARADDVERLFAAWPDSRGEYDRHYEVWHEFGFRTWFLFAHAETDEPVHLQVMITRRDVESVKRVLPWKLYGIVEDPTRAHRGWVYTFGRFRRMGVSLAATDEVVRWCRKNGIRRIYGHRGLHNSVSVSMAEAAGFVPVAAVHQIQLRGQHRHEGWHLGRLPKDPSC
jgi:hypothetical protein